MLTCKIAMPDSPHPIIISKITNLGHFISLDGMNSVFFRFINTFFHFWLLASGRSPPHPLARTVIRLWHWFCFHYY